MIRTIIVAVLAASFAVGSAAADDSPLPLVEEHYQEVFIIEEANANRDWHPRFALTSFATARSWPNAPSTTKCSGAVQSGNFAMLLRTITALPPVGDVRFGRLRHGQRTPCAARRDANPWWWQGRAHDRSLRRPRSLASRASFDPALPVGSFSIPGAARSERIAWPGESGSSPKFIEAAI